MSPAIFSALLTGSFSPHPFPVLSHVQVSQQQDEILQMQSKLHENVLSIYTEFNKSDQQIWKYLVNNVSKIPHLRIWERSFYIQQLISKWFQQLSILSHILIVSLFLLNLQIVALCTAFLFVSVFLQWLDSFRFSLAEALIILSRAQTVIMFTFSPYVYQQASAALQMHFTGLIILNQSNILIGAQS